MQKLSIDVTKIPRDRIKTGKKGKYVDLVLFERPDQYGNDGFVAIDVTKEERESGVKGPIVGNWKNLGGGKPQSEHRKQPLPTRPSKPADPDLDAPEDDIPF